MGACMLYNCMHAWMTGHMYVCMHCCTEHVSSVYFRRLHHGKVLLPCSNRGLLLRHGLRLHPGLLKGLRAELVLRIPQGLHQVLILERVQLRDGAVAFTVDV